MAVDEALHSFKSLEMEDFFLLPNASSVRSTALRSNQRGRINKLFFTAFLLDLSLPSPVQHYCLGLFLSVRYVSTRSSRLSWDPCDAPILQCYQPLKNRNAKEWTLKG